MPDAPGWFSTTTVWPRPREMPSLRSRAITSVAAPGPVGTTSLIGRFGQVWFDQVWASAFAANTSTRQQSTALTRIDTASLRSFLDAIAVYYRPWRSQSGWGWQ